MDFAKKLRLFMGGFEFCFVCQEVALRSVMRLQVMKNIKEIFCSI